MKHQSIIITAILLFAVLMTPSAFANGNNAQKIAVVKAFLNCNHVGQCTDEEKGTSATKRFLSRLAIKTLDNERRQFKPDGDCTVVMPRCYSGLWTEPGNGGFMWHKPKFSVQGDVVKADFGKEDGVAYFKMVKENGHYKIDNSKHISAYESQNWWR